MRTDDPGATRSLSNRATWDVPPAHGAAAASSSETPSGTLAMAEAMAEYTHKRIRAELGFASEEARQAEKMLQQEYRGSRYSFGYPACPKVEDQALILELLGADRLGIELSDESQLHPEQSTSALVILHREAKYFSV